LLSCVATSAHRSVDQRCSFEIYRAEQVMLTSTLLSGGDWHWRFIDGAGVAVVDCGGYRTSGECVSIVEALRTQAGRASFSHVSECLEIANGPSVGC
jgi:hypothetical protein